VNFGKLLSIIALGIIVYSFFSFLDLFTDIYWFSSLGFESVFWKRLEAKVLLFFLVGIGFGAILYFNFKITLVLTRDFPLPQIRYLDLQNYPRVLQITNSILNFIVLAFSLAVGLSAGFFASGNWERILMFIHQSPIGELDPVFQNDISLYFFSYPFWMSVLGWLQFLVGLCLITSGGLFFLRLGMSSFGSKFKSIFTGPIKIQISVLLFILSILFSWEFYLDRYSLLWSPSGVVYGAGYTDLHTRLYSFWFMAILTLLLGIFAIISLFIRKTTWIAFLLGIFLIASIVSQGIIPGLVQKFLVEPNEFVKEEPYIRYNIDYTRKAYGLDKIKVEDYPGTANLDSKKIQNNQSTIRNIRLWDWEPLLSTYRQLQEIRLYYRFNDVDVDRYLVNGDFRQMMLSVREFEYEQVPDRAKTWVNQRLRYTHGYGLVASPVNQVTEQGLPDLFVKDIPPNQVPGMEITRPEIYYGELTRDYIFTNTTSPEFDYPLGDTNQDTVYEGTGGVVLDSFWKRILYALSFQNIRIQISGYFVDSSRIHYHRNIKERVQKLAPFLYLDQDPYPVIANGKIYWIIDCYVTDTHYPYSESFSRDRKNYIRNPVKAIVDAYNGSVQFVVIDKSEPIVSVYSKIFPELFIGSEEISPEIRKHFRYPTDLFRIQAQMYLAYHMTDTTVFYNREDMWKFPTEKVDGSERPVEPYYMIMNLPGKTEEEFMLILPFTPVNKSNMVGWMAVGCDPDSYGDTIVYKFPKQELVYGPMQIESRIDQNPIISEQITLWSQQGSKVIRGNLLVIPIEGSLLYVEPLYLRAKTGQMPELKRVIVAYKNEIVMESSLDSALRSLFRGLKSDITATSSPTGIETESVLGLERIKKLGSIADETFQKSETALRSGNWKEYGEYQKELKQVIQELNRLITLESQKKVKGKAE
jgi:uncharacterized membrane protein (UPF0182 family)